MSEETFITELIKSPYFKCKKKIYAREGNWKKITQRISEEEKFLQSELHCRAGKLCLPEGHLGRLYTAVLLVLVESPFLYN